MTTQQALDAAKARFSDAAKAFSADREAGREEYELAAALYHDASAAHYDDGGVLL